MSAVGTEASCCAARAARSPSPAACRSPLTCARLGGKDIECSHKKENGPHQSVDIHLLRQGKHTPTCIKSSSVGDSASASSISLRDAKFSAKAALRSSSFMCYDPGTNPEKPASCHFEGNIFNG